ncbi:hypothetical protein ACQPVA_05925 [Clostridium butyricum]|uniref:hypothetical protein n=1 Tax=Clostridium butyricum TaxID=1492 RepID=UPI003D32DC67
MVTDRDRKLLNFIEKYKSITISQAQYVFYGGNYEVARRRLKQMQDNKKLKCLPNELFKSKVYFDERKVSDHRLGVFEFLKIIKQNDGEILKFKTEPKFDTINIKPDAFVAFSYKDKVYMILLEVDLNHYTSNVKMQKYEQLYKSNEIQHKYNGYFPIILISRPTTGIRYNSRNFYTVYTDLYYSNLSNILLQNPSIS